MVFAMDWPAEEPVCEWFGGNRLSICAIFLWKSVSNCTTGIGNVSFVTHFPNQVWELTLHEKLTWKTLENLNFLWHFGRLQFKTLVHYRKTEKCVNCVVNHGNRSPYLSISDKLPQVFLWNATRGFKNFTCIFHQFVFSALFNS